MRPSLNSLSSARSNRKRYMTRSVPADVVQTSWHDSTPAARCVRRHRGAGLSPSTEHHSASQAAPGGEPRAAPAGGTARAAGNLHHGTAGAVARATATRQVVARLSPSRFTSVARQRGACLTDARLLSEERWRDRTPRVAHACAAGGAMVQRVALPSGRANDVFAVGGSSKGVARRGSSSRVASCLPRSMAA